MTSTGKTRWTRPLEIICRGSGLLVQTLVDSAGETRSAHPIDPLDLGEIEAAETSTLE